MVLSIWRLEHGTAPNIMGLAQDVVTHFDVNLSRSLIRVSDFPASIKRYTIRIRLHVVRNFPFLATPISYRDIDHIEAWPAWS